MTDLLILLLIQGILVKDVLLMSPTKTWLKNINFNNSLNWDLGRVPCSQDNVIFPRRMGFVVQLPDGETLLRQLVLPLDGELLLPLNGKLQIGEQTDNKDKCQGKDIVFSQWKSPSWVDPNSWSGHNAATPDLEAIPCLTDNVIFPKKSSFSVVMPDTTIRVAALSISGKDMDTLDWNDLISNDEGQAQFFTQNGVNLPEIIVTGQKCTDPTGCECKNENLRNDVCNLKKRFKKCHTPCIDPVIPYGNCCPICGAYLIFKYNAKFTKDNFEKYLEEKLSGQNIDFHISKVKGKIQVVLIEMEIYEEKASKWADEINEDILKNPDLGLILDLKFLAGAYISPTSFTRQVVIFFVFMVIAVCTVFLLFYSYTDTCKINTEERQYLYANFKNQSEEVELGGPDSSTTALKEVNRQAFDNPMYASTTEVEQQEQENSDGSSYNLYSMLEDIQLEKEDSEEKDFAEKDL